MQDLKNLKRIQYLYLYKTLRYNHKNQIYFKSSKMGEISLVSKLCLGVFIQFNITK